MPDLRYREDKMKEIKKSNARRNFIKEVPSRMPIVLYRNAGVISRFPVNERKLNVLKAIEFERMRDDLTKYGLDYDSNQSFFAQFQKLFQNVPVASMHDFGMNENCEFADGVQASKNAYLSFVVINDCENILYSFSVKDLTKNVLNSVMVLGGSNNVYRSTGIKSSHNIFYSRYIYDSSDVRFSTNLKNCRECIMCDNLEHESFCINNQKLEKEEYIKQKTELLKHKESFLDSYLKISSHQSCHVACQDVQGSFLMNCNDVENGYLSFNVEHARNIVLAFSNEENKNYGDIFCAGRSEDQYGGLVVGTFSKSLYNSMFVSASSNIYYSYGLNDCSFCIGCVGLKNKQFCIFNKEYSKEERLTLADKIFAQMDQDGSLGIFFPGSLNPFYFNDTLAYLVDGSFTKEEVTKEGYLRRDEEIKVDIPQGADVIETKDLKNYQRFSFKGEREIDPEIMKKVIKDEKGNFYKIVKMEYDFLMKYGLPLPELHWMERIRSGFRFK